MTFDKSKESLQAAQLCFEDKLCNSAVNRCYYAMFQSAIVALEHVGFFRAAWSHPALQATFTNELIRRREILPSNLLMYFNRTAYWRNIADYAAQDVSRKRAAQLLNWTKTMLSQIEEVIARGKQT